MKEQTPVPRGSKVLRGTQRPRSHRNPGVNLVQPPFPRGPVAESLGLCPFEKGPEIPTWRGGGGLGKQLCSQAPSWDPTGLPQSLVTAMTVVHMVLESRVYPPRVLHVPKRWEPFRKPGDKHVTAKSLGRRAVSHPLVIPQMMVLLGACGAGGLLWGDRSPRTSSPPHRACPSAAALTPGTSIEPLGHQSEPLKVSLAYQGGHPVQGVKKPLWWLQTL